MTEDLTRRRPQPFRSRLYFIRHGETDWNAAGRLQGQRDIPLNGRGRDQAAAAGRTLRGLLADGHLHHLGYVASPLLRARETMALARSAMGLTPEAFQTDDRLKEIAFGLWEGHTWKDIRKREPETAKARDADRWGYVPPGGESYAMVAKRVKPWLRSLEGDTLVVSHGGVGRVFLTLLAGLAPCDAPAAEIVQGRVLVFEAGAARWV